MTIAGVAGKLNKYPYVSHAYTVFGVRMKNEQKHQSVLV